MRPNHVKQGMEKKLLHDTRAVSEVLGFMLIFGIIVSGLSLYLTLKVPEWTKEFEAEHADEVCHDFAQLDSAVDRAILRGEPTAPVECIIGMAPRALPPVIPPSSGTLGLDPYAESLEIIAGTLEAAGSGSGSWNSTPTSMPTNFTTYDQYQVITPPEGAQLSLELGEDKPCNSGHEEYLAGVFWFDTFSVTDGTTLYTSSLEIHAKNITIDSSSRIIADGRGSAGGEYDASGKGVSAGENSGCDSTGGGGAGYGGAGGKGGAAWNDTGKHAGGNGGSAYWNASNLTASTGSGGGGGSSGLLIPGLSQIAGGRGGNGGGAIYLDAPNITITGNLSANGEAGGDASGGEDSVGGGGGGGSGGAILIKGDAVTITGHLYAQGGNGGDGGWVENENGSIGDYSGAGGGGGAGGVIIVLYDSALSPANITGRVHVAGGAGGVHGDGGGSTAGEDGNATISGIVYNLSFPYSPAIHHFDTGYLISNVTASLGHIGFNASNTSMIQYGTMSWTETIPDENTNIIMKVRTSIYADMHDAPSWEDCPEVTEDQDISELASASDGHQYIQWRAELVTFDLAKTPILHAVNISYEFGTPVLVNSSGALYYRSNYHHLPDFQLIYAHGATIRNQTGGEFMLFSPPFTVAKRGNGTSIKVTSMNLAGMGRRIGGSSRTTVKASYRDAALLTGGLNYLNLTFKFTTAHSTTWEEWFNATCTAAGLAYGTDAGKYAILSAGDTVQVTFYGNESRPVNLWLKRSEANLELERHL
jgi:hypothetical protein